MIKKQIPNFLTCANLLCGCVGIVFAFKSQLDITAYMVLLAGIFDFFDGFSARLLNVKSTIGKELDSLADMVSFGFLPGVVMFQLLLQSNYSSPYLPYFGFIITIFSALRLAKFNIDTRQTEDFIGLNTPMNTLFIVSLPFIQRDFPELLGSTLLLIFLTLLMSWLLISEIRIFSLKFGSMKWADNKAKFIFLILSAILIAILKFVAIPFILILYISSSILHFRKKQNLL
ncbi:CDP-diacylglycerol--serine O-phosphatidyltransferase [Pedobacter sp. MC2016-14]|uniref:CDP-diacylglycerol--serine O-phosphatidyltransferase n=1 Tax=Pedobacter sp. MC2016-14 TaxID=2897327 RepID=UPI001E2F0C73|nr:CDP-diacylglycerol--serine O-phosphatidyltransferase [Pedobacter sp. MC2016-14]MCD0488764.1 CDP-diacylglycerol--serine O-phosphatidyltransferase [Pedobacter sp. MC2016-14]